MSESKMRAATMALIRDARLFMHRPHLLEELAPQSVFMTFAPHQLVELGEPGDWVVRLGRLRLSEFMSDGRELTRSILQAGSCFTTRVAAEEADMGERLAIDKIVMMAIGDVELWKLESGTLSPLLNSE